MMYATGWRDGGLRGRGPGAEDFQWHITTLGDVLIAVGTIQVASVRDFDNETFHIMEPSILYNMRKCRRFGNQNLDVTAIEK